MYTVFAVIIAPNLALPFQLVGVVPQLRWHLIIKANSGFSASWPNWAQDSLAEPD